MSNIFRLSGEHLRRHKPYQPAPLDSEPLLLTDEIPEPIRPSSWLPFLGWFAAALVFGTILGLALP